MRQASKSAKSPLRFVVIALAVVVVIIYSTAWVTINEASHGYTYDYDAHDYRYSIERNDFGDVYETATNDMARNAEYSSEQSECRALAFYYEQAVLEHAYRSAGDNDKADACLSRMAEYEAQLGSLQRKATDVRDVIGS